MPQVPYNPVPQVGAPDERLPQVNVNVSGAAFGEDIARAISGMGKTVEGVGDKIFERALHFQNLNNEAEARNAESDYMLKVGQLSAEYNSLEGSRATGGYEDYANKVKTLRESIRGSLKTSDSQRLFDNQSLGTQSRAIFSATSHAAAQQKQFIVNSYDAKQEALRQRAGQTDDELGVERDAAETRRVVAERGSLRGQPPEMVKNEQFKATSELYTTNLKTQIDKYPLGGPTLVENQREKLTKEDYAKLNTYAKSKRDAEGSSQIADDLVRSNSNDDGDLTKPVTELQADARRLAEKFGSEDPGFYNKVEKALEAKINQKRYGDRIEKANNEQILWGGVTAGATDLKELLADPARNAAYQALPDSAKKTWQDRINQYIKKRDAAFNEESMKRIIGLKNNNVEEFLNLDPSDPKYGLNASQMNSVYNAQKQITKQGPGADPRVPRAVGWLKQGFGAQLNALGIRDRNKSNSDDYDHMVGAVQQALDIWQEQHKKPPSQQEFNEKIAPNILIEQRQSWSDFFFGSPRVGTAGATSVFRHDTSSTEYRSFAEDAKKQVTTMGGREPTDEEVYRAFTRRQLLKLYPTKGGAKPGGGGE